MPEWASTLIVIACVLAAFLLMWTGWRRRGRRDAGLVPSHAVPAQLGAPIVAANVLHAATTRHEQPLERVLAAGLSFRANGSLAVHREGVLLRLDGAEDIWIERSAVVGARSAQVAIDKAVERDGLLALAWNLGPTTLDSYFRVLEPEKSAELYDAIDSLTPATPAESEV